MLTRSSLSSALLVIPATARETVSADSAFSCIPSEMLPSRRGDGWASSVNGCASIRECV